MAQSQPRPQTPHVAQHGPAVSGGPPLRPTGGGKKPAQVVTPAEVRAWLRAVEGPDRLRDGAILRCLYFGAMRRSEVCDLTVGGLQRDAEGKPVLVFWRRKRVVRRPGQPSEPLGWHTVGANAELVAALDAYLAERRARSSRMGFDLRAPLFVGREGPLTTARVGQIVTKWGTAAGIDHGAPGAFGRARAHVLRASMASHLTAAGAPPSVVQALLGHSSLATTTAYIRLDSGYVEEAVRSFHLE